MTSVEPFRRLVKLVSRAFYNDEVPARQPSKNAKAEKMENKGIAVVVLDALARRQWMREEELARQLHLHPKQLRRTLHALEDELLIVREQRKENVKATERYNRAAAAHTAEEAKEEEGGELKMKKHTHTYCCIDYAQIYDVTRYRIHRARRAIKDELEDRNTLQEYVCPKCASRYTALDASRLLDYSTGELKCDREFNYGRCNAEVQEDADKYAHEDGTGGGGGEDNTRRRRREKLKELQAKMERQLKPVVDQLARLKDLQPPYFGSLAEWELRATASQKSAAMGGGDLQNAGLPRGPAGQPHSSAPMPFFGETKVEVNMGDGSAGADAGDSKPAAPQKIIPAWVIREGMNLTAAQRGEREVKPEPAEEDSKSAVTAVKEEAGATAEELEAQRQLQEYYAALYYAAQEEAVAPAPAQTPGMLRVKAEAKEEVREEEPAEEETEWEEGASAAVPPGGTSGPLDASIMESITAGGEYEEDYEWEGDDAPAAAGAEADLTAVDGVNGVAHVKSEPDAVEMAEDDEEDVEWDDQE
eukprot:jgi/Mesen1/1675/ME000137S00591